MKVLKYKIIRPSLLVSLQEGVAELSFTARIDRYSPSIHYLTQQGCENLSTAAVEPNPSLLQTSAKGVVEVALDCAHRTSTVSSCAFCEQEGHLTAPDLSFSGGARSGSKESFSHPCAHLLIVQPRRARRMVRLPPPPIREGLEAICETRCTRASVARRPGGVDDGWLQRYCTSMVMVWLAASRSWSFVAPLTVILCVPLLRPLNVPVKPR